MIEIDIPGLIARHSWIAEGFRALEDNYREYQHDHGISKYSTNAEKSKRGWFAASEVLVRQIADLTGIDASDVQISVKGHLFHHCGRRDNPKGLEAWRRGDGHATVA